MPKADKLLLRWDELRKRQNETTSEDVLKDLWETFVWDSPFEDTSRQFFALPKDWNETFQVLQSDLMTHRKEQSTRSLEWLAEHGICGDNMKEGLSEIPQAGRGAFATRPLKKDSIVAPLPLLHVAYRKRFDMYKRESDITGIKNKTNIVGQQLLLNYCFGHRESTLLLCPYGLLTALINHGNEPNVKLRWSDPSRSAHEPEWLNKTVTDLVTQKFAVLTMEFVALRDIEKGEEIVVDYGEEWVEAWKKHVETWKPVEGADSYVSAVDLNADPDSILKTEFEQMVDPYPANVGIKFDLAFTKKKKWYKHLEKGTLRKYKVDAEGDLVKCDIVRSSPGEDGRTFYTVVYTDVEEADTTKKNKKVEGVPREAFIFKDRAYTGDFHQSNVFRHDMRIPDEIFPASWKNRLGNGKEDKSNGIE